MNDNATEAPDPFNHFGNDLGMQLAKLAVDLNERVITVGRVADQMIGPDETAEPAPVNGAGRHVLRFVDEQPRQVPFFGQERAQSVQQFFICEFLTTL